MAENHLFAKFATDSFCLQEFLLLPVGSVSVQKEKTA